MVQSLRGMNDIFGENSEKFVYIIETASKIAKNYGFKFIETPLLEETALFKRSVGESSDIVGKEMYQFIDKSGTDVSLRPEGTAGVVRALIEHKLDRKGDREKFFYFGSMFRYERPQRGRLRLFHQFGCESFGESSVLEDVSIILMAQEIFDTLGISTKLKINSLGCEKCFPDYRKKLENFLIDKKDELCSDCHRRINTNPIRTLDCKIETCKTSLKDSPKITYNLCDKCNSEFELLKRLLIANEIDFEIDTNLVRGLDYYSRTAFEFISNEIGSQSAVAGGGRYDKLVEFLDGKSTPAVGFALGIERIIELIKLPEKNLDGYYFGTLDKDFLEKLYILGSKKRKFCRVHIEYKIRSLKTHITQALKMGYKYCAILGSDEVANETIWIKDLEAKFEDEISQDSI